MKLTKIIKRLNNYILYYLKIINQKDLLCLMVNDLKKKITK